MPFFKTLYGCCCIVVLSFCLCCLCSSSVYASNRCESKPSCLCESKPYSINLKYTGKDCSASDNDQSSDKATCSGDPADSSPVYIFASKKCGDTSSKNAIGHPSGPISINEIFTITHVDPTKKVQPNACIDIYSDSARTNLLQRVQFHTSCSQPLKVGDIFGSIKVISGINGNKNQCGEPECTGTDCDKPKEECEVSEAGEKHIIWFSGGKQYISATCNDGTTGVTFSMLGDDTGHLEGCVSRRDHSSKRFIIDVTFSDLVQPGDANYPPTGSPKDPPAGADTSNWKYFLKLEGNLLGEGSIDGLNLRLSRKGPAIQLGDGAGIHGSADKYGLATWFNATSCKPGHEGHNHCYTTTGDFNLYLDCQGEDCLGVIGGNAEEDDCGVCDGNNKDKGCDGVCFSEKDYDQCGICDGSGPGPCGCDLNVVPDECGVCGGPGQGPCGCGDIVRDECGICGGEGPGECGCDLNIVPDECGICGGEGPGECGCDLSVQKDSCGVCGGPGPGECGCSGDVKDSCGVCGGEGPGECGCDLNETEDECGICGGPGKDQCGVCPQSPAYGQGKDQCGLCPQDPNYGDGICIDCAGIPNGPNVEDSNGVCCLYDEQDECGICGGNGPDECGICGGSGTNECGSCDGDLSCTCEDIDNGDDAIEIDSFSAFLLKRIKKVVRLYKKAGSGGSCSTDVRTCKIRQRQRRRLAKEVLKRSTQLHMNIWTNVWTNIGGEFTICPEGVCPTADLRLIKQEMKSDLQAMYIEFKRMVRKVLSNQDKPSRTLRKQIRQLKRLTDENLDRIDEIPDFKSLCDD
ncbi:MAG: hypothetical protein DRQ40_00515 [Gammaproteobacteria bacterium]|nr:MAG: hypothetical protein DRQ40_00515 [Gammaproteobacteria bacterium]